MTAAVASAAPGNVQAAVPQSFLGSLGGVLVNGLGLAIDAKFNRLAEPDFADSLNADEYEAVARENAKQVEESILPGVSNSVLFVSAVGVVGLVFLLKAVR